MATAVTPGKSAGPGESLDRLVGDWSVFQLRRGHRFSTDDVLCGWEAARSQPGARRLLDLGSGIGSVGLTALWALRSPRARLDGIEAQEISWRLARRSVRHNGLEQRVRYHLADLRDASPSGVSPCGYDLVMGSPPYVPLGRGVVSPVPQRAAARMELRGSVFDYCAAARRYLAPGGRFCFVMAAADPRLEQAPPRADLVVLSRLDVCFRAGRTPHIAVLGCARAEDAEARSRRRSQLVVRDEEGRWTEEYEALRRQMAAPDSAEPRGMTQ